MKSPFRCVNIIVVGNEVLTSSEAIEIAFPLCVLLLSLRSYEPCP
ncbi:hypothetical protein SPONL_113 [uncultured Candidatus Thioglobus sp.]|nr:hypothetical protein SPONL_113 [uncultured Candidatus Thioglobus sp.]